MHLPLKTTLQNRRYEIQLQQFYHKWDKLPHSLSSKFQISSPKFQEE